MVNWCNFVCQNGYFTRISFFYNDKTCSLMRFALVDCLMAWFSASFTFHTFETIVLAKSREIMRFGVTCVCLDATIPFFSVFDFPAQLHCLNTLVWCLMWKIQLSNLDYFINVRNFSFRAILSCLSNWGQRHMVILILAFQFSIYPRSETFELGGMLFTC